MQLRLKKSQIPPHLLKYFRSVGHKPKDLIQVPFLLAEGLRERGWYLRQTVVWEKPSALPESVQDRPSTAHEYVFLLAKSARYFFDGEAIKERVTGNAHPRGNGVNPKSLEMEPRASRQNPSFSAAVREVVQNRNSRSVWSIIAEPFSGWTETVRRVPVPRDEADGGTKRITSEDCPVHGSLGRRASILVCGGREGASAIRTGDTDSGLAEEQPSALAPTDPKRAADSREQSSGSPRPPYESAANDHSSESRKMVPALETSSPCNVSDQTSSHTGDIPKSPEIGGLFGHTPESNNEQDGSGGRPSVQKTVRNAGKISSGIPPECTCSFYREITEKTSHFATFPTALVKRCLLAGTSAHGVCEKCGAPWRRVMERKAASPGQRPGYLRDCGARNDGPRAGHFVDGVTATLGWAPSCKCAAPVVPATCLDPFGGSGTVAAVAQALGRRAILAELKPEYCEMTRKRISGVTPALDLVL